MINGFEFARIKTEKLPKAWQEDGVLDELEKFLQDNWQQRSIFYEDRQVTSRQQFIDFDRKDGIKLQNYIGTIIFKGEQLNIFPKIFKEDEDDYDTEALCVDELNRDLVFWLGYCDKLNFPFVSMKGELRDSENLLELFITVYVHYVKAAIDRQRYYQYEDVSESSSFVRGKIDFKDYALKRFPCGEKARLKYTYSSFVFDNLLNKIIKCTCSFLLTITRQAANKVILRNILMKLGDVEAVSCKPYDCDKVYLSSHNSSYRVILSMSKMFLLNKVNSSSIGVTDSFCFLFPAEVLFEGFVGGFIKEMLHGKAEVTTQASDQYLADLVVDGEIVGNAFLLKEDILIEKDDIIVVDTKYKEIERFWKVRENRKLKISDSDMKQMAIYAAKRGAKRLYLIYPLHRHEEPETMEVCYDIRFKEADRESSMRIEILKVPFACKETEEKTRELLKSILQKVC